MYGFVMNKEQSTWSMQIGLNQKKEEKKLYERGRTKGNKTGDKRQTNDRNLIGRCINIEMNIKHNGNESIIKRSIV